MSKDHYTYRIIVTVELKEVKSSNKQNAKQGDFTILRYRSDDKCTVLHNIHKHEVSIVLCVNETKTVFEKNYLCL